MFLNLTILRSIVISRMKFIMIDAFKGASGKLCRHSDMGATFIGRTGKTYSHKLCNKRNLEAMPYSEKELSQQSAFKTRSAVIGATVKSLTDDQRKALLRLRNERGLYSFRVLIEGIYDKETRTVPAAALAELVALGKKGGDVDANVDPNANPNANPNPNSNTGGSGGGTSPGGDGDDIA